jgi:methyltransferase
MLSRAGLLVTVLTVQRFGELVYARRNERALRRRGARESGRAHYPLMVALHAAWLASMAIEARSCDRFRRSWLVLFAAAQVLRYSSIRALGPQWTTRVLVDETRRPVVAGPYRFLSHPNYVAVAVEIVAAPASIGASRTAGVFGILDLLLLRHRIGVEKSARHRVEGVTPVQRDVWRPSVSGIASDNPGTGRCEERTVT